MRKRYFLFCFLFLTACVLSPGKLIKYRWSFSFVQSPALIGLLTELQGVNGVNDPFKQVLHSSKLIIRDDESFDMVLFDNYWHGTWTYNQVHNQLALLPENQTKPVLLKVDTLGLKYMQIELDSSNFKKLPDFRNPKGAGGSWFPEDEPVKIGLIPDKESYSDKEKDPYSIKNNSWRIKPENKESDKQIKQRVLNHLSFFKLLFEDAYKYDKNYVTYDWFVSPVLPASNGIALKNYEKIKLGWEACFFDSAQAAQGYELLRGGFSAKIKFPDTENRFLQSRDMIDQLINNIKKSDR
ncbi:hypothetical protein ACI6Q2_02645 [Chitinophagaceae bacterium LWZ2-11]